jgi:hypothetical protein
MALAEKRVARPVSLLLRIPSPAINEPRFGGVARQEVRANRSPALLSVNDAQDGSGLEDGTPQQFTTCF